MRVYPLRDVATLTHVSCIQVAFCNETHPNVTAFPTEDDDDDNISQGKGLTVD